MAPVSKKLMNCDIKSAVRGRFGQLEDTPTGKKEFDEDSGNQIYSNGKGKG